MKRMFIYLFILLLLSFPCFSMGEEDIVIIPQGTVIRVYPNEVLSTLINQEGDRIAFINQADMWIEEFNAIPLNTRFEGYVSVVKKPVKGVNGAIGFAVDSMILPSGRLIPINAVVQANGQNIIGGGLTPPSSYNYTIHSQKPWGWFGGMKGVLQFVPSGEYDYGKHTTVGPKDPLFIVFQEDVEI